MKTVIAIAVGGGLGSLLRYYTSLWAVQKFGGQFPYGTLIVNVVGCFLIGCVMVITVEKAAVSPYWRLLLATGFLGGLTTFSSFSYETVKLMESMEVASAIYNVLISVAAGLAATWLGITITRMI